MSKHFLQVLGGKKWQKACRSTVTLTTEIAENWFVVGSSLAFTLESRKG